MTQIQHSYTRAQADDSIRDIRDTPCVSVLSGPSPGVSVSRMGVTDASRISVLNTAFWLLARLSLVSRINL